MKSRNKPEILLEHLLACVCSCVDSSLMCVQMCVHVCTGQRPLSLLLPQNIIYHDTK